jgi:hypothetical protein
VLRLYLWSLRTLRDAQVERWELAMMRTISQAQLTEGITDSAFEKLQQPYQRRITALLEPAIRELTPEDFPIEERPGVTEAQRAFYAKARG